MAAATAGAPFGLGRGGVINYHLYCIGGHILIPLSSEGFEPA
jgi:hypothetical protein